MLARSAAAIVSVAAITIAQQVHAQTTERVSVSSSGVAGNGNSLAPSTSGDGLRVAFESDASNLVSVDTNGVRDIFVRDRGASSTRRVSISSAGVEGTGPSSHASISANGDCVAFRSLASNLVSSDANGVRDIFVHNLTDGTTTRVSVSTSGGDPDGESLDPVLSADGRFVAFTSAASNLVAIDTNALKDVFVHDRTMGSTVRVSISSFGVQTSAESGAPDISGDGRFVAFESFAWDLAPPDVNGVCDVFVRDLINGTTVLASIGSSGGMGNENSQAPSISTDGRFVAFQSWSTWHSFGYGTGWGPEIYVRDLQTGQSECVSLTPAHHESTWGAFDAALAGNANFVAMSSTSDNLILGDTNGKEDVFLRPLPTGAMKRVSVSTSGAQANGESSSPDISADGRFIVFQSGASNIVAGSNGRTHIYVRDTWITCYMDADADGYGNILVSTISPGSCGQGYVQNALDCDDADPLRNPAAAELCNGIDDNCDGVVDEGFVETYCTSGTTVHGCVPQIAGEGAPSSIATSGFDIVVRGLDGQRYGTIFYGFYPAAIQWAPFSPSFKCVASPVTRTGVLDSGGTAGQCNGELRVDFNAWMQANPGAIGSPFVAGQVFHAQGWFRDPGAPKQTNLSNGLRFTLCQ